MFLIELRFSTLALHRLESAALAHRKVTRGVGEGSDAGGAAALHVSVGGGHQAIDAGFARWVGVGLEVAERALGVGLGFAYLGIFREPHTTMVYASQGRDEPEEDDAMWAESEDRAVRDPLRLRASRVLFARFPRFLSPTHAPARPPSQPPCRRLCARG